MNNLYGKKIDNLEEMDRFLEKLSLPRLNQEVEIMNNPIKSTEIEAVIKKKKKKPPKKQKPRARWLHRTILSNIQRRANVYPSKSLQKIAEEETLPYSFYKATITPIPKPGKDNTKKENYRPMSLMNIDAELLNKILANRIQQNIKTHIHHNKLGLFQECKDSSIYINQSINVIHHINNLKNKNHMIISIDT